MTINFVAAGFFILYYFISMSVFLCAALNIFLFLLFSAPSPRCVFSASAIDADAADDDD